MQSTRIHLKLYAESSQGIDLDAFVPIFHRWIRDRVLSELMIDVVDYKHVHDGPGIVLIGHGSDYYLDQGESRLGLLYSRKRGGPAGDEFLVDAFRHVLHACRLLEAEPSLGGKLRFRTNEALVRFPDRLSADNSDQGLAHVKPALESVLKRLYPDAALRLERLADDQGPLTVRLTSDQAPALASLIERIGQPAAEKRLRVM